MGKNPYSIIAFINVDVSPSPASDGDGCIFFILFFLPPAVFLSTVTLREIKLYYGRRRRHSKQPPAPGTSYVMYVPHVVTAAVEVVVVATAVPKSVDFQRVMHFTTVHYNEGDIIVF